MRSAALEALRDNEPQARPPIKNWRIRAWYGAALIAFSMLSLLYLRLAGDVATAGYDVANLQGEANSWEKRNEQARLDVARLESLDRIAQIGSDRLKMGPAQRVVYVKAARVVVPAVPTPVASPSPAADPLFLPSLRQILGAP